jgi:hypothetical protein
MFSLVLWNFNIKYLMHVKCYGFYYIVQLLHNLSYSDDDFYDKGCVLA